jgi:hypothetical protein
MKWQTYRVRRRRCRGRLHGLESALLLGPVVAVKLVPSHLVLTLALVGVDEKLLSHKRGQPWVRMPEWLTFLSRSQNPRWSPIHSQGTGFAWITLI